MAKHLWSILCGGGLPCPASMPRDMRRRRSSSLSPSAICALAAKLAVASASAASTLGSEASATFASSLSSRDCSLHDKMAPVLMQAQRSFSARVAFRC